MLINATELNLINFVHPKTGASVRMWAGIGCVPIEWGKYFV